MDQVLALALIRPSLAAREREVVAGASAVVTH
jgi:hypothetical protein